MTATDQTNGLTRRSVLRRSAATAGAVSIGVVGFSGSAAAHYCPRTPGYYANHDWCTIIANSETGTTLADLLGLSCSNGQMSGSIELVGTGVSKTASEWQDFLVAPPRGDKGHIMAKTFLAARLNTFRREEDDEGCLDESIDLSAYGLGTASVRDVVHMAADWLRASNFDGPQRSWTVDGVDGEPLKDVLDAFNNGTLGLDCDCDGSDSDGGGPPGNTGGGPPAETGPPEEAGPPSNAGP